MKLKFAMLPLMGVALASIAQVSPPRTAPAPAPPPRTAPAPAPAAAVAQPASITPLLPSLQQATGSINLDIARLRIDKWKADSAVKEQAQHNADSISRNIGAALPGLMDQVTANPQSLAAAVKLYRNVNALYDVLSGLTESAGAFGPKQEYDAMANDTRRLDDVRRDLGDRLVTMAAAHDTEMTRLRGEVTRVTTPPPLPKKIIVDEEPHKPAKKPAAKKKTATTAPAQAAQPAKPQ